MHDSFNCVRLCAKPVSNLKMGLCVPWPMQQGFLAILHEVRQFGIGPQFFEQRPIQHCSIVIIRYSPFGFDCGSLGFESVGSPAGAEGEHHTDRGEEQKYSKGLLDDLEAYPGSRGLCVIELTKCHDEKM